MIILERNYNKFNSQLSYGNKITYTPFTNKENLICFDNGEKFRRQASATLKSLNWMRLLQFKDDVQDGKDPFALDPPPMYFGSPKSPTSQISQEEYLFLTTLDVDVDKSGESSNVVFLRGSRPPIDITAINSDRLPSGYKIIHYSYLSPVAMPTKDTRASMLGYTKQTKFTVFVDKNFNSDIKVKDLVYDLVTVFIDSYLMENGVAFSRVDSRFWGTEKAIILPTFYAPEDVIFYCDYLINVLSITSRVLNEIYRDSGVPVDFKFDDLQIDTEDMSEEETETLFTPRIEIVPSCKNMKEQLYDVVNQIIHFTENGKEGEVEDQLKIYRDMEKYFKMAIPYQCD